MRKQSAKHWISKMAIVLSFAQEFLFTQHMKDRAIFVLLDGVNDLSLEDQ